MFRISSLCVKYWHLVARCSSSFCAPHRQHVSTQCTVPREQISTCHFFIVLNLCHTFQGDPALCLVSFLWTVTGSWVPHLFACSWHVCVGLLRVLRFPPTVDLVQSCLHKHDWVLLRQRCPNAPPYPGYSCHASRVCFFCRTRPAAALTLTVMKR